MLYARLFGGLDLSWDERPLPPLPGAAARSLLAYLLTYRDRPHTRDLLSGTFWPDLPDATARRRLSQALWQIGSLWRKAAVSAPWLQAAAGAVQIHPDLPLWLDTAEFVLLQARASAAPAESLESLAAAARCADLYRGEFLAGYYDDWIVLEREGLRGKLLLLLERQLEGLKGRGEYEQALACARRLAAEDPWREEAHREIMRLCYLLGRDDEALRQYEACGRILRQDLDSPPAPETAALAAEIAARAGRPAPVLLPARPPAPAPPRLERPDRLPLAGRQAELAALAGWVEAAVQRHGGLVILYGEAGVGKSRLLRELAAHAQWRGVRAAWGHCCELAAPPAYQPLVEALRAELAALRAAAIPPPWAEELSRLLPELAAGRMPPPPPETPGRLLEALAQAFRALAAAGPLLVILEDAHWMDAASLAALRYLLPRLAEMPLLIVISVRREDLAGDLAAQLAAMERTRLPHSLSLERLDGRETAEFVQRALDLPQPAPRFSARLHAETEGNPFYLVETLLALVRGGALSRDEAGMWRTPWDESTADYAELPLPAGVVQSIAGRLDSLSPDLRDLLCLAAVIGRDVDFRLWLAAAGCAEEALLAAGDELCRRGLLLAASGGPDYAFAHDLIRRVAYERLPAPRRRAGHRRVAAALARVAPDEPAALAYHWTQAQDWARSAYCHRQAGDRARSVYANTAAAAHYAQALDSLARLAGPDSAEQRYDLLLAREAMFNLLGERPAQLQDLQSLEGLAAQLADAGRQAEVALRRAAYGNAVGDFPVALAAAQDAVRLARSIREADREAAACLEWGYALLNQGEFAAAQARCESAAALARRHGLPAVEGGALRNLGSVAWCLGDYARAESYYAQALAFCRAAGDRRSEGLTLNNLAMVLLRLGDCPRSTLYSEQALRLAREIGDLRAEGKALGHLANVAMTTGAWAQAQAYTEQAMDIAARVGNRSGAAVWLLYMGTISSYRGDYARAVAYTEQALQIIVEIGDRRLQGAARNNLGEMALHRGDYARAQDELEQALAITREMADRQSGGPVLHDMGRLYHRLGDYARAAACYAQALQINREIGDTGREALVQVMQGLLAHHRGDHPAAAALGQAALDALSRTGDLPGQAAAWTVLGHAAAGRGAPEEAAAAYTQALALRRQLEQPHLAAEPLAGLARCALAQGQPGRAQEAVEEIMAYLQAGTLDGTDEPLRVYLTCYQALQASQDPRAPELLRAAHTLLHDHASRIAEDDLRRAFLQGVEAHRQLAAACRELAATPPPRQVTVSLPRAGAPAGRPLRPDELVAVTWTLDAPGEADLPKTARRRQCLRRMLAEARAQGALPRDEDLARALGVGLATVRRDMAALRAAGTPLPPRRR